MEIREQLVKRFGLMEAEEILQAPVSRQCKECGGMGREKFTKHVLTRIPCSTCKGTEKQESTLGKIYEEWKESQLAKDGLEQKRLMEVARGASKMDGFKDGWEACLKAKCQQQVCPKLREKMAGVPDKVGNKKGV